MPLKLHWFTLPKDKLNRRIPEEAKIEIGFTFFFPLNERICSASFLLNHHPLKNQNLLSTAMGVVIFKELQTCPGFKAYH